MSDTITCTCGKPLPSFSDHYGCFDVPLCLSCWLALAEEAQRDLARSDFREERGPQGEFLLLLKEDRP